MTKLMILLIAFVIVEIVGLYFYFRRQRDKTQSLKELQQKLNESVALAAQIAKEIEQTEMEIKSLTFEKEQEVKEIENLKSQKALEEKELSIKKENYAAQIQALEAQVKGEYEQIKYKIRQEQEAEIKSLKNNPLLEKLRQELEDLKLTRRILEEEKSKEAETFHFNQKDIQDLKVLRTALQELNRGEIIGNILWTVFFQKPLQEIREKIFGRVSKKVSGIYKITNINNQKVYVGQSVDISSRFAEHLKAALILPTDKFHKEMQQLGPENFSFFVIEECEKERLNERERYWIDFYNSTELGYNSLRGQK